MYLIQTFNKEGVIINADVVNDKKEIRHQVDMGDDEVIKFDSDSGEFVYTDRYTGLKSVVTYITDAQVLSIDFGKMVSPAPANEATEGKDEVAVTMQLLEMDDIDDLYGFIGELYSADKKKLAAMFYNELSAEQKEACVEFLGSLYHYDAVDNDELPELSQMVSYFTSL